MRNLAFDLNPIGYSVVKRYDMTLCCLIVPPGMQEYSSQQAAITWGIVLLVLVPVVLVILFVGYKYVKNNEIDVRESIRSKR